MLVVGLTGGIATGKSTVSAIFKAHGVPVIDADIIAREVVLPGTHAYAKIVAHFGTDVVLADGSLDRPKLGSIVFTDEHERKKLNSIVHPAVRWAMLRKVMYCWLKGERLCILDVPLLIEGPLWQWMGKVLVVYCPPALQLQRLMARDKSTEEAAAARISSQLSITSKLAYADIVIENSGTREALEMQVDAISKKLRASTRWTWLPSWVVPPVGLVLAAWTLVARRCTRRVNTYVQTQQ